MTLTSRLAVAGETVAAGTKGQRLQLFQLPDLELSVDVDTNGQCTWGPFAASDGFVLATDRNELVFVTTSGEISWQVELDDRPAGMPAVDGDSLFIAWQLQGVSRVSLRDGSMIATTAVAEPLVSGPVPFAGRFVLAASDGTLLVIDRPEE